MEARAFKSTTEREVDLRLRQFFQRVNPEAGSRYSTRGARMSCPPDEALMPAPGRRQPFQT